MKLKRKSDLDFKDPTRGPVLTVRAVVCLVLFVLGIAWIAYYYVAVRPEPGADPGGPAFVGDLGRWNYVIGFGLAFVGLALSAHPSTPLAAAAASWSACSAASWSACSGSATFYVISDDLSRVPVFDDLGQYNLVVGIGLMAIGFTFATRWE